MPSSSQNPVGQCNPESSNKFPLKPKNFSHLSTWHCISNHSTQFKRSCTLSNSQQRGVGKNVIAKCTADHTAFYSPPTFSCWRGI